MAAQERPVAIPAVSPFSPTTVPRKREPITESGGGSMRVADSLPFRTHIDKKNFPGDPAALSVLGMEPGCD